MFLPRLRPVSILIYIGILAGLLYCAITVPGPDGWINSWQTMDSAQYLKDAIHDSVYGAKDANPPWDGQVGDKVIVMAKMPDEDASWVEQKLPDWQRAIYPVPENTIASGVPPPATTPPTSLTLPANKGHESMAYITYLIDFYHFLPSVILFLHAHEDGYHTAWHVDARLHSNVAATRELRFPLVHERGYVNLRCNPRSNCLHMPGNFHPPLLTKDIWREFWANTSTPVPDINYLLSQRTNIDDADDKHRSGDLEGEPYPPIADPSGAQFAVSRETVRKRPREDYVALRAWLLATDLPDAQSGRVFEYLWHILFGMPGVLCYERAKCECDVFGRCS